MVIFIKKIELLVFMDRIGEKKYNKLKKIISGLDSAVIAFSGGADSALVLKAAYDALGNKAIAVTADSPSVPRKEIEEAKKIAGEIGAKHIIIGAEETKDENYLKNPGNRCYYCKSELYSKLKIVADRHKIRNILNGANYDDIKDYRPGMAAAEEYGIISPLRDAEFTKNDVRGLAKELGLKVWDKPASPCLASRVPYGMEVTLKKLSMIEEAEGFLKDTFGIRELRVRHFGNKAKIEVNMSDFSVINKNVNVINKKFNEIGFNEIELNEFKSGSLNLLLNAQGTD